MRFNARMEPVARRILAPASVALASLLSFGSAADGFARDTDGSARDGQAIRAEPRPRVQRIAILPDRTTGRDWGLPYLDAAAEDLNVVRPDAIFNVGDMIQGYTSDPARWEREATEYLERVLFQLEAHHVIEKALAADERQPTIGTLCFSSGMGAISALMLSVLRQGDAVVLGSVYGCTDSLARNLARFGITARFVDVRDPQLVADAVAAPDVAMLFVESPENPTLHLCDLEAASAACEAHGVLFAVDNTFCSPWLQQPFRLGADVVVHSLTKFINGHSASIAGAMLGPFPMLKDDVFVWYKDLGATPSPFDAWLNSLTVQALAVRQASQSASAQQIAEHLLCHPAISAVHYPGLPSHPQHALARRQMRDGGSLIAFELKGGMQAGIAVMNYFARKDTPMELAVSLGGAISYVQHPASMTHSVVPELDRHARGISDGLVRLSVGLEGASVLLQHLDRALAG